MARAWRESWLAAEVSWPGRVRRSQNGAPGTSLGSDLPHVRVKGRRPALWCPDCQASFSGPWFCRHFAGARFDQEAGVLILPDGRGVDLSGRGVSASVVFDSDDEASRLEALLEEWAREDKAYWRSLLPVEAGGARPMAEVLQKRSAEALDSAVAMSPDEFVKWCRPRLVWRGVSIAGLAVWYEWARERESEEGGLTWAQEHAGDDVWGRLDEVESAVERADWPGRVGVTDEAVLEYVLARCRKRRSLEVAVPVRGVRAGTGLSISTVSKSLARLRAAGWLEMVMPASREDAAVYRFGPAVDPPIEISPCPPVFGLGGRDDVVAELASAHEVWLRLGLAARRVYRTLTRSPVPVAVVARRSRLSVETTRRSLRLLRPYLLAYEWKSRSCWVLGVCTPNDVVRDMGWQKSASRAWKVRAQVARQRHDWRWQQNLEFQRFADEWGCYAAADDYRVEADVTCERARQVREQSPLDVRGEAEAWVVRAVGYLPNRCRVCRLPLEPYQRRFGVHGLCQWQEEHSGRGEADALKALPPKVRESLGSLANYIVVVCERCRHHPGNLRVPCRCECHEESREFGFRLGSNDIRPESE